MKRLFAILFSIYFSATFAGSNLHAGGNGSCVGLMCGGQRTYWTDEQRAQVEGGRFGGLWSAMGEREHEMFPNFYRAGGWLGENVLGPAAGVAFGPWMQENFWNLLAQTPPDIDIIPRLPGEGYVIAPVAGTMGKWGKSVARLLPKLPRRDLSKVVDVLIDQGALQLAKRKAQVAAGERTVTYWRVQNKGARDIIVDPLTGAIQITPGWSQRHGRVAYYPRPLFVSRGGSEHAEHFARLRTSQGLDVEVISFEVPQWFDEFVVEAPFRKRWRGPIPVLTPSFLSRWLMKQRQEKHMNSESGGGDGLVKWRSPALGLSTRCSRVGFFFRKQSLCLAGFSGTDKPVNGVCRLGHVGNLYNPFQIFSHSFGTDADLYCSPRKGGPVNRSFRIPLDNAVFLFPEELFKNPAPQMNRQYPGLSRLLHSVTGAIEYPGKRGLDPGRSGLFETGDVQELISEGGLSDIF